MQRSALSPYRLDCVSPTNDFRDIHTKKKNKRRQIPHLTLIVSCIDESRALIPGNYARQPDRIYILYSSRDVWRRCLQYSSGGSFDVSRSSPITRLTFSSSTSPRQKRNYQHVTFASDGLRLLAKLLFPLRRQTNQRTRD